MDRVYRNPAPAFTGHALVVAGGAERILALDDRIWFKVKVDTWRAASCEVDLVDERIPSALGRWWIAAAGSRRGDSAQEDFYEQLTAECRARRKAENVGRIVATTQTSTAHLGIASTDWMPEPGGVAGIKPEPGEILWSAPMPTEAAQRLLAESDELN